MELLSEWIETAGWTNDLLASEQLYDSWGYLFPCHKSGGFHIITQGKCYARISGQLLELKKGDVLFITKGISHELLSEPNAKVVEIQRFKEAIVSEDRKSNRLPITSFVSVRYEVPDRPMHPFFRELPPYLFFSENMVNSMHGFSLAYHVIASELGKANQSRIVLTRMTDVMLYYAFALYIETSSEKESHWIAAFRDPLLLRSLEKLHDQVAKPWTIESLARDLGVSRAHLALRFKETLGIPPMEYLGRLRMEKARSLYEKNPISLEELARQVGYSSSFSFSKAYKKFYGVSPAKEWKGKKAS